MIIKPLLILIAFLIPSGFCYSNPYLYRIVVGEKTSWILGTLHVDDIRLNDYPGVKEAILASRVFVQESSFVEPFPALEEHHYLPGTTVKQVLDIEKWEAFSQFMLPKLSETFNIPEGQVIPFWEDFIRLKPGLILRELDRVIDDDANLTLNLGASPKATFDMELFDFAEKQGLEFDSLESRDPFRDIYAKRVQAGELSELIGQALEGDGSLRNDYRLRRLNDNMMADQRNEELVAMYKQGLPAREIERRYESFLAQDPMAGNFEFTQNLDEISRIRHVRWMPAVYETLEEGGAFVAVGLSHTEGVKPSMLELIKSHFGDRVQITHVATAECVGILRDGIGREGK